MFLKFNFYGYDFLIFSDFRKAKMDYNLAPYLVLHFSQAINDELEGLKGLPDQLGKKKTKNLDALLSLIWWCLFIIYECWRLPEEQNVPNIQNDKILWLLSHCDIVLIFEVIYSGYVSLILLI